MTINQFKLGLIFLSCILFFGLSQVFSQTKNANFDPLKYVDPFIGVDGHGNVFPGAALPFV